MSLFPGVALITGAASGISQATALTFARSGCRRIVLADRNTAGLAETTRLITQAVPSPDLKLLSVPTDVSNPASISALLASAVGTFGRIDYAVNGAGVLSNNEISTQTSVEEFDRINGVNYRGCWLSSRAELAQMMAQERLVTSEGLLGGRGSIVNIASQLGIVGRPAAAAYCASKAAVISLTKSDAIDYSSHLIRVNCVCPGVIDTPMTRPNAKILAPAVHIAPMGRMGTAQEVADCVVFLASSKASFVQGAALVVDGGYTIN